jgi:hypothetical protein
VIWLDLFARPHEGDHEGEKAEGGEDEEDIGHISLVGD